MQVTYEQYAARYEHAAMRRENGILEVRLHTDGGPLVWGAGPHAELGHCFADIGSDRDNRVIVLTGTGDEFCSRLDESWFGPMDWEKWNRIYTDGRRLLNNLLAIEVPVVAAVNGPARVHAELLVLSDVVVAAEHAFFQDLPHFRFGTVPGDGVHVVWPLLLGPNKGREFLLLGTKVSAEDAERLGVVAEVARSGRALDRAWEIARQLAKQPDATLRYTRAAITQHLRRAIADGMEYGLALEGLGAHHTWPGLTGR